MSPPDCVAKRVTLGYAYFLRRLSAMCGMVVSPQTVHSRYGRELTFTQARDTQPSDVCGFSCISRYGRELTFTQARDTEPSDVCGFSCFSSWFLVSRYALGLPLFPCAKTILSSPIWSAVRIHSPRVAETR